MYYSVGEVKKEKGKTLIKEFRGEVFIWEEKATPVTAIIKFTNLGETLLLKGNYTAEVELLCSRCIESFILQEKDNLLEEIKFKDIPNDILDIGEILRENILLALPLKPLCHPECKGLCEVCGENLNITQCNCALSTSKPGWEMIKDLLKK